MTLKLERGTKNSILRTVSKPVAKIDAILRSFALDMTKAMAKEKGVGLAAPQVGKNIRMIVCRLNPGEKNETIIPMVNPEILSRSDATEIGEEGCLSVPGVWGQVERSSQIIVRFRNLKDKVQTLELLHFNARIIQHEIDHLDGILFVDKATELKEDKKGASKKVDANQI